MCERGLRARKDKELKGRARKDEELKGKGRSVEQIHTAESGSETMVARALI